MAVESLTSYGEIPTWNHVILRLVPTASTSPLSCEIEALPATVGAALSIAKILFETSIRKRHA
jgi:hypothetical protein